MSQLIMSSPRFWHFNINVPFYLNKRNRSVCEIDQYYNFVIYYLFNYKLLLCFYLLILIISNRVATLYKYLDSESLFLTSQVVYLLGWQGPDSANFSMTWHMFKGSSCKITVRTARRQYHFVHTNNTTNSFIICM